MTNNEPIHLVVAAKCVVVLSKGKRERIQNKQRLQWKDSNIT